MRVKRVALAASMMVLALVAIAVPAKQASAAAYTNGPIALKSRAYCEAGKLVTWKRLVSDSGSVQGRVYAYRRDHRICVFVVDRLPGAHAMRAQISSKSLNGWDQGTYNEYAGAMVAPPHVCVYAFGSLVVNGKFYDRRVWVGC
ncbi:hypothetical protein FOE78_10000 [Microlunatus elymi]|uniref:Secreted protein n=1 Tax=Microlunatus elymi TaxID=2596828 RepID=A0A516PYG8_9ACTN|nr:hypothetical protein [Microlunatus elymi]QDP96192.1 hypothetical protein FOE78_10000 [Microlunatus elymi]